jgi:hypothetical protein
MKIRRIAGCAAVVALIAGITLAADNIQSNFVPGDFGPAAEKLRVQQENGYYDLGEMLNTLAARTAALEAQLADQGVQIALLTQAVESLTADVAAGTQSESDFDTQWVNQQQSFARNRDITLVFQTLPGAVCQLGVIYLGTGRPSSSPAVREARTADARGIVQWTWELTAKAWQDAQVTVTATLSDGRQVTRSWAFAVVE